MNADDRESSSWWLTNARVFAAVVITLGLLPIANWIPGGFGAAWYEARIDEWISGSAIAIGMGVVLYVLSRRIPLWRDHLWRDVSARAAAHAIRTSVVIGILSFATYAIVALVVFDGDPLHLDELTQVFQARVFSGGSLAAPLPDVPEFSSLLHLVDHRGLRFSQFPPGGPLMLVPGVLLGAPWLASPAFGAGSAVLMWSIARRTETPGVALGATLLLTFAPFVVFMSGSHMNHVPSLFWMLVALYALVRCAEMESGSPRFSALCGIAFGVLATIRPVDALAFAAPAALWMVARAVRHRNLHEVAAAGLGVLVPLLLLLWFNMRTTGLPLLFAYEHQWGKAHGLGFHAAPWGIAHSPARGLELINLYLLRLQTYLFESPVPALIFPALALGLAKRLSAIDRYLLVSSVLLLGLYFAYWHDGFYLGPRFTYLLVPALALWSARLFSVVRARWPRNEAVHRSLVWFGLVCVVMAVMVNVPVRTAQYAHGLRSMRLDVVDRAREQHVRNALIFVRESWGSQIIARLWALGVSRAGTEVLYRTTDACALDSRITTLEHRGVRGAVAESLLRPLAVDSLRVVPSMLSPDRTERMLPGSTYGPQCGRRIAEDRQGFTLFAPLVARGWDGNIYARDLHGRDSLLLHAHPGRAVYLLRPESSDEGAGLVFLPLRRDSLLLSWRADSAEPH